VLWFLSHHLCHHKVEHDGNGKIFLLLLVFCENVELSITRFCRVTKLTREMPRQRATLA